MIRARAGAALARGGPVAQARARVQALGPWFHDVTLPCGVRTAPEHWLGDFPASQWRTIAPELPRDLSGASALDIGCNAGFYTVELAKRGARVLAIDHDPRYLAQARFVVRSFRLEDRVTLRRMDVYDVARLRRTFDLVLFMGVLYHLRHPLLALDVVRERVSGRTGRMVFQTLMAPDEPRDGGLRTVPPPDDVAFHERSRLFAPGWPKLSFVERRLARDPTNWWVPNRACVEAMLRAAGFHVLRALGDPGTEVMLCERGELGEMEEFRRRELDAVLRHRRPRRRRGAA